MRFVICALMVGFVGVCAASDAAAICRRIVEVDSPAPVIEPEQPVLLVKRTAVQVGQDCVPVVDAGAPDDGVADAGTADAWIMSFLADAGAVDDDAGIVDAGAPDATPLSCEPRYGDAVTMVVQPRFTVGADGARFALLMVTPSPPQVSLASPRIFTDLAYATAPEVIVETITVEDPSLGYQCSDPKWNQGGSSTSGGGCGDDFGGGGGGGSNPDPGGDGFVVVDGGVPGDDVNIQTIGAYEVAVLAVTDVPGFADWLTEHSYLYGDADLDALRPYIELGWSVVVVRVDAEQSVDDGGLEPLAFTYEGDELRLPVGVSRQPAGGEALLTVYVAADQRYDMPGGAVDFAEWTRVGGGRFLTRTDLFVDLSSPAAQDPIGVRRLDNRTTHETTTVTQELHIPSSQCPPSTGSSGSSGAGSEASLCGCGVDDPRDRGALGMLVLALFCAVVLSGGRGRRRHRRDHAGE